MNRSPMTLAGAALLAGCAVLAEYGPRPLVPVGSELVLHQRLALAPGATRVYIQDGAVVDQGNFDRYRVACYLRLQRRGEEPLVGAIRPGRFLVVEGSRSRARSRPGGRDDRFIDPPSRLDYSTGMEIRSDLQPQVDALHCRYNGYRIFDEAPGPGAIREALGEVATLRLHPQAQ